MTSTFLQNRRDIRAVLRSLPVSLALTLTACGGPGGGGSLTLYPVQGQVLLAGDKPLKGGRVVFFPKEAWGLNGEGEVGADGSFHAKTADGRDGLPAGEYRVGMQPPKTALNAKTGRPDPKLVPFPPSYLDEDGATGLTATVKAESNTLPPFKLVAQPRTILTRNDRN